MYGMNYGYRSGLNKGMVKHLQSIVSEICEFVSLQPGDLVIDIGSNDSTLLQSYPEDKNLELAGIDPTGIKFRKYYPDHIKLIPEFFSAKAVEDNIPGKKAKVITSIAMFYDLEDPTAFVQQVFDSLSDNGVWVFEQSYLPSMLATKSYDTICHEHLEYYAIAQINYMFEKVGFKIIRVSLNDANGGSFRIMAAKSSSSLASDAEVEKMIEAEKSFKLDSLKPYEAFAEAVIKHKDDLLKLLAQIRERGERVLGYGASTKGNVLLQYCGIDSSVLPAIAEVNEDKFGSFTPKTAIPIISEKEAREMKPNYFLVLPWHFRKGIVEREQAFLQAGGKLIFPLPRIEIVSS